MKKNPHAVALGRKGGSATKGKTSQAKAAAARKNGTKGGRPPMTPGADSTLGSFRKAADMAYMMVNYPQSTIKTLAASEQFAHLGDAAPDLVAQAFGFKSFSDVAVKHHEYRLVKRRKQHHT